MAMSWSTGGFETNSSASSRVRTTRRTCIPSCRPARASTSWAIPLALQRPRISRHVPQGTWKKATMVTTTTSPSLGKQAPRRSWILLTLESLETTQQMGPKSAKRRPVARATSKHAAKVAALWSSALTASVSVKKILAMSRGIVFLRPHCLKHEFLDSTSAISSCSPCLQCHAATRLWICSFGKRSHWEALLDTQTPRSYFPDSTACSKRSNSFPRV
mmetsp:Transcript_27134/g.71386  ORF Transcript_27134/g.71386 Transcript_27134/m.71386 type:complete len:217 (+) Transcript_27134:1150-1800(+)